MKKVLLSILLAMLPLLTNSAPVEINGICYNLETNTKKASVTSKFSYYIGDVTIPESIIYNGVSYAVTSIENFAFYICSGLTSVTIPNSVTSIGEFAFFDCSGLTSVIIPNSVTSIESEAISACLDLTSINVEIDNPQYDSRDDCNAIIETSSNTLIAGCMNTIIPNSVTSIGSYAFEGCSGLTSITIPNSITSIGEFAFSASGLTSIKIPNSVTSIGKWAFSSSGLTSVTIPNSVTSISDAAFNYCSGLTSITIPNSITSIGYRVFFYSGLISVTIPNSLSEIGEWAFYYCSGLKDFYSWAENVPSTNSKAFEGTPCESATLHVPAASVDAYKNTYPWSQFGTIVALTDDDPKPTDILSLKTNDNIYPVNIYTIDGKRKSQPQRGLNIIRMGDGTTKKVILK